MAFLKLKNRAASTLASGVSDSDTSWTVATGEGARFPSSGDFHVTCEDEIVKCTSRSSDVLTVTRAQEGTGAAAHTSGKAVELRITAGVLDGRTTWTADKLLKGGGAGVAPVETLLTADLCEEDLLGSLYKVSSAVMIPTNAGWTQKQAESGASDMNPTRIWVNTGATANSWASISAALSGFNLGGEYMKFDWDKKLYLVFTVGRYDTDAEVEAWLQLRYESGDSVAEDIDEMGLGIKFDNLALKCVSYNGSGRAEIDPSVAFTVNYGHRIAIVLDPGVSIKWYVDDVLKATQSDTDYIPSGSGNMAKIKLAIKNGASGGTDCYLNMMNAAMWQEI